ncbi:MAG: Sodium:neurotransmitter symporter family protein [Candidatus Methanofastidiosum methylothiophilum]|jgi:NSS family neurotransmitter:Na+ symporter|uniref:Transporter n=1 Tax=Candidatus Methanofastidiosum methylothiophilum TaxID=1705564 RepID=A0A150JE90_9EURY|nr:MAG: Sodium:neurotransmitter symporter family protein [Candidatus Methanofastidiosum methylthiophilus]MBP6932386.1 sodium-dependent transporter [Methanofastidiosum sp.]OQC52260.1 MAG: Sodium:neurotransmitter symporter family protein [Euryarchaeota archaeon ADurb.Bin023]KYC57621.1 MAG: Sodium:neurotransmitter symporter family protein [Candidatus Methanofastidiosum methylthiophilus]KYC58490.1 MAG: Sodium:neurotransmitter symporter family protein [Candidatus Methanofastidiosum methylthiophilus]
MEREVWNSKIGFLLAATGSAMGLGNVWRFPYITGANGGAAFVLIYFIIVFSIGVPVMLAEFAVGRSSKLNAVGAFKKLKGGKWPVVGWIGIIAGFIILSYYSVIAGWTIKYFISSFTGLISPNVNTTTYFNQFTSNGLQNIFFQAIFILITIYVVYLGVEKGIETWSKILMPILILILLLLVIRGVSLPGAPDGIRFYLNPNFSEVTGRTILAALGQAFFSLSLGMGAMITYGSYIPKEISLPKSAFIVTFLDMLLALLAGFVIFPTAFTFGIEPGAGTGLIFITLPSIFALMPFGQIWSALFFLLLFIAALTSAIGLLEVSVAYVKDERNWSRKKAALALGTTAFIIGVPSALSNGTISLNLFGMQFLDAMDYLSSNILLPLGGIFVTLFVGWVIKDTALKEINLEGKFKFEKSWIWICRTIAPISIFLIFLAGIGLL